MSKPSDYFDRGNFVPMRLVDEVLADTVDNPMVTPITERGGDTIWHYHSNLGIFKPDGVAYVEDQAKKALGPKAKPAHIAEVLKLAMIGTYADPALFVEDPNIIVLENGVYHLDAGELTPHSSIHHAKAALPVKYDPDAKCPAILKFLDEVIPDAVPTFQEWLGYHLYKDMIYHKAAMFIGDGANGKTTLQDVMNAFLGRDNVSHVNLYKLVEGRFSTSELYLKLANISPEIASSELKRTGAFKSLTGHDRIMAEKKYRDPFYFTNYAKLTFLCNQLPTTPDQSSAFFRRWLLFIFPNKFEDTKCDPKILDKLTTPEELSGLLNWAREGLRRLQENGRFTKSMTADELQEQYESMSDPITAFIQTHIIASTGGAELKSVVYQAYYRFCRDRGYVAVTTKTFTGELKSRIAGIGESDRKIRGRSGRCWTGIQLVETTDATITTLLTPLPVDKGSIESRIESVVIGASVVPDPLKKPTPVGELPPARGTPTPAGTLQEKLKEVCRLALESQGRLGEESLVEDEFVDDMGQELGYPSRETRKLLETLVRDGQAFRPAPGRIKFVRGG